MPTPSLCNPPSTEPVAEPTRLGSGYRRVERVMGTVISVDVRATVVEDTMETVFEWFRWVDETFSTYKLNSEVSRLGRGDITVADCDPDVGWVLEQCEQIRHSTNGYFDLMASGVLDPSGFVKGWSVEVASAMLSDAGATNHCINAGGDVRLRGEPEPGRPWRTGVVHPFDPAALSVVVEGRDLAVATSSTAERGLHVIDPHTRRPADALASVTLIGPELTRTDAYATAALAMGLDAPGWLNGLADYEAYVIDAGGFGWWTPGLAHYVPQSSVTPRA